MISASAIDPRKDNLDADRYDDFLLKPLNIRQLLDKLQILLSLQWTFEAADTASVWSGPGVRGRIIVPPRQDLDDLRQLGEMAMFAASRQSSTRLKSATRNMLSSLMI